MSFGQLNAFLIPSPNDTMQSVILDDDSSVKYTTNANAVNQVYGYLRCIKTMKSCKSLVM